MLAIRLWGKQFVAKLEGATQSYALMQGFALSVS
jgi:hypothetical protein